MKKPGLPKHRTGHDSPRAFGYPAVEPLEDRALLAASFMLPAWSPASLQESTSPGARLSGVFVPMAGPRDGLPGYARSLGEGPVGIEFAHLRSPMPVEPFPARGTIRGAETGANEFFFIHFNHFPNLLNRGAWLGDIAAPGDAGQVGDGPSRPRESFGAEPAPGADMAVHRISDPFLTLPNLDVAAQESVPNMSANIFKWLASTIPEKPGSGAETVAPAQVVAILSESPASTASALRLLVTLPRPDQGVPSVSMRPTLVASSVPGAASPGLSLLSPAGSDGPARMPAVIRQGGPGSGQPAGKGDTLSMSGSTGRESLRAAPTLSPQDAGLLLATVDFDPTALQSAVEALVAPILEVDGQNSLYWVGVASWGLAAVLVCETLRQRLSCRSLSGRCRPPTLIGLLPEDRP